MGRASLSRYYPYHYAPFLSDIRNVSGLALTFDLEKPFMPFQQLLAVLPAASKELLPQAYRVSAPHLLLHSPPQTQSRAFTQIFAIINTKFVGFFFFSFFST